MEGNSTTEHPSLKNWDKTTLEMEEQRTETEHCPLVNGGEQNTTRLENRESDSAETVEVLEEVEEPVVNSNVEEENLAPDGGFGWFIVLGSLLVHLFIGGIERSAGIIYLKFEDKFEKSAAATAWATSLPAGLRLTLGPVCSILCNRYSARSVVITGGVLLCISLVITSVSPTLSFTYASFGVLGGFGRLLAYAPAVVIVGEYFNKRRGLAVGIATSGVGFGSFLFPTIIETIFNFYGFFGAFLILGAVMLNISACGCLFRPLWLHLKMKIHDERRKSKKEADVGAESSALWEDVEGMQNDKKLKEEQVTNPHVDAQPQTRLSKIRRMFSCGPSNKDSKPKTKLLELSLMKDLRFTSFCAAILLYTISSQAAFVFIPAYAKSKGVSELHASYIVSIIGLFDGTSRIVSGFLLDMASVKQYRIYIYNAVLFLLGFVSLAVPSLDTFAELSVLCAVYGLLVGAYISQKSVVIVDILGVKKLVNSFGLLICFQGIGMFLGPPIAGFMKDVNGHYDIGFYFGGASMFLGAFILAAANVIHYIRLKKQ
ncbi:monocarboxylate transporter 12-like [Pecten maximus]|uniref:monocarboxylate transporter 12-like n=1 Tax=Pecten maximus TaxID=6579 RepID=UPI0014588046|nr:monocarboxylate transporter 12-like [Pecten maximus]XP_033732416.1 monocarboxylate transporter 12-like [Pecten maximus]